MQACLAACSGNYNSQKKKIQIYHRVSLATLYLEVRRGVGCVYLWLKNEPSWLLGEPPCLRSETSRLYGSLYSTLVSLLVSIVSRMSLILSWVSLRNLHSCFA